MAREEQWSVKVRMSDSTLADALVDQLRLDGRNAGRFGRRVSIVAHDQEDANSLAAVLEASHPDARVEVRGD